MNEHNVIFSQEEFDAAREVVLAGDDWIDLLGVEWVDADGVTQSQFRIRFEDSGNNVLGPQLSRPIHERMQEVVEAVRLIRECPPLRRISGRKWRKMIARIEKASKKQMP